MRTQTSTTDRSRTARSDWPARFGLFVVLAFFCVPLFIGLGSWDLRNDEAIYSYAVDRILETGDWLTPRTIPYDVRFLEKPPLKFWMVAGAIRSGVLPHDERGLRLLDAVFGAIAFGYVFMLGCRLAGAPCGVAAVFVLFTLDGLLFDHGLRSNNMEAALVLAYCGGIYHFARWADEHAPGRRRMHALAVAAWFVLGFMTKFVAVLFLPLVCAAAFVWRPDARARLRTGWRDWLLPVLLVLATTLPWFVYQAVHSGSELWRTMFGEHVYTRFTGALDVRHLQPWPYYYVETWTAFSRAGSLPIALLGGAALAVMAWKGRPWLVRLLIVWWVLPYALISIGTSKVFHYTYPFLPPIALGAGLVATLLYRVIERRIALDTHTPRSGAWTPVRRLLLAGGAAAFLLGVWTAVAGRVALEWHGVELLRSSTASRPIFVAAILCALSGYGRMLSRPLAIVIVAIALPIVEYPRALTRTTSEAHPLRTLRDCAAGVKGARVETHLYPAYGQLADHAYYYYLRGVGPWIEHAATPSPDELRRRLYEPGEQALLIVTKDDYDSFTSRIARGEIDVPRQPTGLALSDDILLLTPGPFEPCALNAAAVGGRRIGAPPEAPR